MWPAHRQAWALNVTDGPRSGGDAALRVVGKGSKPRLVPVLPVVREAMAVWLRLHPLSVLAAPLSLGARGGGALCSSSGATHVQHDRGLTGLPEHTTPQALSHLFATHLLAGAADFRAIRQLLGHANLSATQRYTTVDIARLMEVWRRTHRRRAPRKARRVIPAKPKSIV